jgi:AraC-like DNA-binding protein
MAMNEVYDLLSIFVTGGLFLACGLMFLFTAVSRHPLLGNYRKARYAMAGAYLFFVFVEIIKYLFRDPVGHSVALLQTVTLSIAAPQALLFTLAMLALVEVRFPGWRYIFWEVAPVLLFDMGVFLVYAFCSEACFRVAFYSFVGVYALLLMHYTLLFIRGYRMFRYRMDNYYSDGEVRRLHWVVFSFAAALGIGVGALLSSVFMSTLVALVFTVIFDAFYTFFAVRFVNYPRHFQVIERAMDDIVPEEIKPLKEKIVAGKEVKAERSAFSTLEKRIEQWVANRGFTEQGITIETLAIQLHTNNKYLSVYINTYKKQTFREWINELRIEEAQRLLLEYPEMTVSEVAVRTGFLDKSHFLRRFKKRNKLSPTEWKRRVRA